MSFRWSGLLAVGALVSLTACGGGGGGGGGEGSGGRGGNGGVQPPTNSLTYTGATTPANLSLANSVPELSAWLLIELGLVEGLSPGSIAVGDARQARVSTLQKRLNRTKQLARSYHKATAQAVTNEPCAGGGSAEVNDNDLLDDGTGVVILTYRNCLEGDSTLNGVIRVTVTTYDLYLDYPTDYT
ncbi:MAG: hypothetical protein ABW171_02875, partial [Steroidobacter sp.]